MEEIEDDGAEFCGVFDGDGVAEAFEFDVFAVAEFGELLGAGEGDEEVFGGGDDEGWVADVFGELGEVGVFHHGFEEGDDAVFAVAGDAGLDDAGEESFVLGEVFGAEDGGEGGPGHGFHAAEAKDFVPGADDGAGQGGGFGGGAAQDEAVQAVGGVVCEAEGDAGAVAEADEVCAVDVEVVEDGGEVGGVLFDGEFEGADVALALAAGVVGEDAVLVAQAAGVGGPVEGALGHAV